MSDGISSLLRGCIPDSEQMDVDTVMYAHEEMDVVVQNVTLTKREKRRMREKCWGNILPPDRSPYC